MAGAGFRDIVRTLKVCLFTTKLIKSHVKLTPLKSPGNLHLTTWSRIFLPATILCMALLKLATSQADHLRSACSLAITLYQTHIVLCPRQVWGARPKKGLSSSKHSSAKLIKAFHKSISKSLFGKRTEAFLGHCPVLSYMVSTEMTRYWTNSFIVWWKNTLFCKERYCSHNRNCQVSGCCWYYVSSAA